MMSNPTLEQNRIRNARRTARPIGSTALSAIANEIDSVRQALSVDLRLTEFE